MYGLPDDLSIIQNLSKDAFKKIVNKAVEFVITQQLKNECSRLKKTYCLAYEGLQMQQYLKIMYPAQVKLIL